ncbi:DEAD/DEAH box helicase [Fusibacter ferrireducens]|uniref:DEAD/DEAH box helicase n=1 Tax=Fusibacter ferrireducens TaxID=2785058 RepID=A0ABR9ZW23_9FIRM|nr:DEAD/DEAH box helicase [Fusibacter ferrireducens]MBF4694657.1 DEAD/DEAH box helicase [Fusibacter ferrireducens]
MTRLKASKIHLLNAYFLSEAFVMDEIENQSDENIKKWTEAFDADKYGALFHLGFLEKESWFSPSIEYLYHIATLLIKKLSQQSAIEFNRETVQVELGADELQKLKEEIPFVIGMEYVDDQWIQGLWASLLDVFKTEIKVYEGTVARYFAEHNAHINIVGRVFFHLVENKDGEYPFAFMATYSTKPVKSKRAVHTPLKNALKEFDGDEKKLFSLISTVIKAAEKSAFISDLLESGELFSPLKITGDEAYTFLKEIEIYEEAGIMCRVPDWWKKKYNSVSVSVAVGAKEPSKVGLDAIMDFEPSLLIGDEQITPQELSAFLEMGEGLVQYKGKWVEINKNKLEAVLDAFNKVKRLKTDKLLSLSDAMRMELNVHELLEIQEDDLEITISNGQWLRTVKENLKNPDKIEKVDTEPSFHANLRAYQETGYHWLNQMSRLGFGACLADDMGLGKTVQMIAFLEHQRVHNAGSALLVLPASLIGNWKKEIEKFAPDMPYQILHKSDLKNSENLQIREDKFLHITTYGMAVRLEALKDKQWTYLILDEAQAIKNPGTKQTKAIKAIPAKMKIAMTGTPIENKLGDLWSLFDFLNQGLLGTPKEFTNFTKGLAEDMTGYAKLRKMIQPFILRRLKTDKSIIADLPDKLEMNAYTTLSKKQIALYKQLLEQISKKLDVTEGIERKGLVLSSIMKFKQICNHPDQYLGLEAYKEAHSGKFEQLRAICETIHEKRERVLIFTQFREMTAPISEFLSEIFLKEGFVLHGGTPVKKRNEIVEQFNGEHYVPYMVLSLKAGGVGLNLTAANHVIHFDRWWNPAVENQATDRTFRIGQTKNVMVHKFVTKGTIEEKIDAIIEEKQKLSGDILSSTGEQWLTEYNNEELMQLFALGGDL